MPPAPTPPVGNRLLGFFHSFSEGRDANIPFSQQHPEIHSGGKAGSTGRSRGTPDNEQEK